MKSFMVSLVGLVLSVSVGAEPLLKGRVWLASGPPAAGVHVRLFDLTDLHRSVGTTTDEAGHFALRLQALSTDRRTALPDGFALGPNYPNPFNPSTIIPYQIPTTTHVRLEVFNLLGQRLATLVDGARPAGAHTAQWDATDAAGRAVGAGVFIYRLTGGGHTVSRRMVLIDGQAGIPAGAAGPGPSQTAAVGVKTEGSVYGLAVAGAGLIAYVDPAFRVGTDQVDVVLEQPGGQARMKVATGGILGDVNNDSQVDAFDVLYVALYSQDPSITLPNNGDISLGDVNGDGTVDLADGLLLALYKVNPSDPTLPPGIGQPVDGSGDDHGDTPSSATSLAVGSSQSGQLETGGDVDYFRVEVAASGELTVHTTGNLDTKGQLEDSAGGVLARDDDGGDGYNFRIAHAVRAGTYYIKVEGYNATTTGSYTIHASGPVGGSGPDLIVASASVSDNTLTPAQSFTLNATVRNQGTAASAATTVHYYQSPDATITADDSQVGTDPVSGLSADETSAVSIELTAPSSAGTYYYGACVASVSDESNTDNNCSPGVQVTVGSGDGDDHGDTPSSATSLAVGGSQSGQLETGGDVDYFRVEVAASGELTVHTTGSLDTKGQLEDSAGGVLARDDDGGDGYNFRLAHAVSAGTYYLKVEGYDASTTGSYTIHAVFTGPQIYNDNVFVLPVTENLAAIWTSSNSPPLEDYTARFYEHFNDEFDFLIFFTNVDRNDDLEPGAYDGGFFAHVKNDVQGIGLDTFSNNSSWGSAGKLEGVIFFSVYEPWHQMDGYSDFRQGTLLHELMHRWGAYLGEPISDGHWNGHSNVRGSLGGVFRSDFEEIVDLGGGRYTGARDPVDPKEQPYPPLELYLAGFMPPEEVPDIWAAVDGEWLFDEVGNLLRDENGDRIFSAREIKEYTIEDIIAEHGPRVPDHLQAQKDFRAAVILLVSEDYPATREILESVSDDALWFSHAGEDELEKNGWLLWNFYEATGGRGTITMDDLSHFQRRGSAKRLVPSSFGTPPSPIVDVGNDRENLGRTERPIPAEEE